MAKKKKFSKKKNQRYVLDQPADGNIIEIDIRVDGKIVGTIAENDYELHRLLLESQQEAANEGHKDNAAYLEYYAKNIEEKYNVKPIQQRTAYQIANIVCNSILDLKKSTNG